MATYLYILAAIFIVIMGFAVLSGTSIGRNMQNEQGLKNLGSCKEYSEDLKDSCLKGLAYDWGNHTICSEIQSSQTRDVCIKNVARKTGKPEICNSINNSALRGLCYSDLGAPS